MQPPVSKHTSNRAPRRTAGRTAVCVGITAALGGAVLLVAILDRGVTPTGWRFGAAVVLVALSELLRIPFWRERTTKRYSERTLDPIQSWPAGDEVGKNWVSRKFGR
jgi:uncharacterized membrane protein